MIVGQKRIIHRFIRPIADYEEGGIYYNQVIPIDTQAYAYYPKEYGKDYNLWYVFGDGVHTYTEIREGKGLDPVDAIENSTLLGQDLQLASFDLAELTVKIEDEYDIATIEEIEAERKRTGEETRPIQELWDELGL